MYLPIMHLRWADVILVKCYLVLYGDCILLEFYINGGKLSDAIDKTYYYVMKIFDATHWHELSSQEKEDINKRIYKKMVWKHE